MRLIWIVNIMEDLLLQLESNEARLADEIKQKFHEQFNIGLINICDELVIINLFVFSAR